MQPTTYSRALRYSILIALAFVSAAHAARVDGYTYVVRDRLEQALDLPIAHFVLDTNEVLLFVDAMRHETGIALCVELLPQFPLAPPPDVPEESDDAKQTPVVMENTTPRRILDAFTSARPEYTWLHVGGNRVNLLPVSHLSDPEWRGHHSTGAWEMLDTDIGAYFKKLVEISFETSQPFTTSTEVQQIQPTWANHPRLLQNRRADIRHRDATLLEALDALAAFGPDVVWTVNGPFYQFETILLDDVYPAGFQQAEAYRRQGDAEQETALALYQMAFEEAPYADLQVRVGMAIMEVYLGRSMPNATPHPEKAMQMCKLLLDARPKYPYDETLWRQYITLLYQMGRQSDAQWAVRAHCPPGAPTESYPCRQAKQLVLWMAGLYGDPEEQIAYLVSKQNVFPEDPHFNDELDARTFAIRHSITTAEAPKHDPYAQFNQGSGPSGESGEENTRYRHNPRRVKR